MFILIVRSKSQTECNPKKLHLRRSKVFGFVLVKCIITENLCSNCLMNEYGLNSFIYLRMTHLAFTCLKLTIETLEQRCEICLKLTIKPPKRRHWRRFGGFIVNFEHVWHLCSSVSIVNFEHVIAGWVCDQSYCR